MNWGAFFVALTWFWILLTIGIGVVLLSQRAWGYRRLKDGLWQFRLMALLWASSLVMLSAYEVLVWFDVTVESLQILPVQDERWGVTLLVTVFLATASAYSLRILFRNHGEEKE